MTHPMLAVLGMSVVEILIILVVGLFTFVVVPALVVVAAILFLRRLERRRHSPAPPAPPPMVTSPPSRCPQCGTPLPVGALTGLCPACLLRQGAADTATQPEGKPSAPLPVAEVARLFPQFEILEFIGQGGMGTVYKARQPALDRLVALKLLPPQTGADPGFAERFSREARALAHLSHPNIVAIYDFGTTGGMNYFLMEFVDGVNLRQLQRSGHISPREALQIVPQICDALQYAHDEGVVHRDIKPENVLVDRKGRVKIADFGLAKILGRETLDFRLTREGQVMGTPHYMAPEQVEHPLAVDHRADIYALGVVFYEMLTGELPLGRFQPPSRKVQVDVRLDEVVLHALEKEPDRRYQHASEVKTAVETIASYSGTGSAPAGPEPLPTSPSRNLFANFRTAVIVGLAVWFIVVAAVTVVTFVMTPEYRATATVLLDPVAPANTARRDAFNPDLLQREMATIQSYGVLDRVIGRLELRQRWSQRYGVPGGLDPYSLIARALEVHPARDAMLLRIQFFSTSPNEAAELANAIVASYMTYRADQLRAFNEQSATGQADSLANQPPRSLLRVSIIEAATPSLAPARPNKPLNVVLGLVIGLALGAAAGAVTSLVGVFRRRRGNAPGKTVAPAAWPLSSP